MRLGLRGRLARGSAALAVLAVVGVGVPAAAAVPQAAPARAAVTAPEPAPAPDLDRLDPPVYSYDDAIVEYKQVPVRVRPGGADGRNPLDLVWVDIIRPRTPSGVKVPTIMMSSPYFNTLGRGYKGECKTPHTGPDIPGSPGTPLLGCSTSTPFPEWYDEYFVPRGYSFAAMDLRGTRNSSGCQVYGDRDEVYDAVDVVDWLSEQTWSNGKVGMTGGSYDGTIANGAAAEQPISGKHPDALGAVIPIRAIDDWYDYHFFNGVESSAHQATPALFTTVLQPADLQNSGLADPFLPVSLVERRACVATLSAVATAGYAAPYQDSRSAFWSERDFSKDGAGIRAATLLISGLFDFNVKTINVGNMWTSLPASLPKRLVLFNGDHADPKCPTVAECRASGHLVPFPFERRFVELNHRWWLQFLKGVDAGALAGPQVLIQRNDGHFDGPASWPSPAADSGLFLTPDGGLTPGAAPPGSASYADTATGATSSRFLTTEFPAATRLSGQIGFDLLATVGGPDTTFAVQVDDLPPGTAANAPVKDQLYDGRDAGAFTVTYGWLRAYYRDSVNPRGRSRPTGGSFLVPGSTTRFEFPSLYTDYVVPAGHRLRFTISNSAGSTAAADTGGTISLLTGPGASRILLPVAATATPADPGTEVPEVPLPAALPLAGIGAAALATLATRRRRREDLS